MNLDEIAHYLRNFDGISRKFVLPDIIGRLREASYNGNIPHALGEDSAAISTSGDEYVLHTTDAIVEELCVNFPRAAGFNVVLANVMDIYAAGGTPTSFAVALSYSNPQIGESMLQGLIDGTHVFCIPIVRGHTNSHSESTYVVGSATGIVKKENILTAGGAQEGDDLILLFDAIGKRGTSYKLGWDSVTNRSSKEVMDRLSVMNDLALKHLLNASKDVSVAGIVGTAGMLVEYSGKGGIIDLDIIDEFRPPEIEMLDWLRMYISLGFLVSANRDNTREVKKTAEDHAMTSVVIGTVNDSKCLHLRQKSQDVIMFDFSKGPILTPQGNHESDNSPS
jgi:selenophosphate synthetase-related protein